jgi:hypothetical protein
VHRIIAVDAQDESDAHRIGLCGEGLVGGCPRRSSDLIRTRFEETLSDPGTLGAETTLRARSIPGVAAIGNKHTVDIREGRHHRRVDPTPGLGHACYGAGLRV